MPNRNRELYPRFEPRLGRAATLQQRVAAGVATPTEAEEYQRTLNVFRRKFRYGCLSPESARRFGIE
jgi:hypothetical protein